MNTIELSQRVENQGWGRLNAMQREEAMQEAEEDARDELVGQAVEDAIDTIESKLDIDRKEAITGIKAYLGYLDYK